ncbi:hypothetical protein PIROE2DRAFT_10536 [Piromyces sp. E2]|nr:hypothetical protein PIROE2DRAFT_10536 [Piromyces sp. E2]|eukprot:OUM63010.1 hypothetical protein PIROE2DRAFT_10536 [Piromyces sp. E2]
MKKRIRHFRKKESISEKKAIKLIKNLVLIAHFVPSERTDFHALCGDALLHLTKFINKSGSRNFKILYALYRSQVKKDESSFNDNSIREIVEEINIYFRSLTKKDKKRAKHYEKVFKKLLEKDKEENISFIKQTFIR